MKLKVYRGQYGWSVMCATKYGSIDNKCYIQVRFINCPEPEGQTAFIEEKGARFGAYKKKLEEGKFLDYPTLTIFDYQLIEGEENRQEEKPEKKKSDLTDLSGLEWF